MKTIHLAIGALTLGASAFASAATFNGNFDGFCDGFSITVDANGVAHGVETGCVSGPVVGTGGTVRSQGRALSVSENHLPGTIYVIRQDHTWSIYLPDGSELQNGTWSDAAAGVRNADTNRRTGQL